MGSPIETWEGATAFFTGAGGSTPTIILIGAVAFCAVAIILGGLHESHAYKTLDDDE